MDGLLSFPGGFQMRRIAIFVLLTGCFALAQHQDSDKIGDVRALYDGKLLPDVQVNTFRHIDRLFPSRKIARGKTVHPLPKSPIQLTDVEFTAGNRKHDLADFLSSDRVAGLLVIKDGRIALEDYELGNTEKSRWVSWSMAKSICSTLAAAALKDGYFSSLDDPLTKYLPELAGGAYGKATVRNVLQMSSGVKWDETYTNPKSDRRHMLDLQIGQKPGEIIRFLGSLPNAGEPGTIWKYSTGETQMISAVIHAAIKRPLADYLSEKIWSRYGMEEDGTWWLDSPNGQEIGGSGLSATLRDYGRFGQFVLDGGKIGNDQVVPEGWFAEAGSSKIIGGKPQDYGYMWWTYGPTAAPVHQGAFRATGIFGQGIYINPREHVVIVVLSARSKPSGAAALNQEDFFAGVISALNKPL
ncbi:MAG TPA: serine hydrolase [Bryobacteraceae bacterium]|nr:serine hydrolase [Bryobacteraceae bacterium]